MSTDSTYTLKHTLELRNTAGDVIETISELKLRRLTGKDLKDIANANAKGPGEAMAVLICRAASIPPSTFERLDAEDAARLGVIAADFIGGALPTGAT
jgi:hypothetical protein